jgi:exodeoxyribonuclease V beta subunit
MKNLDLAHIQTSGLHLIEASAGTGKTWTIAALYIVLLLESRLQPEEILVVTYTKAATSELRDRVRARISDTLELYTSGRPPRDELERIILETRATDNATAVKLLTRALYSFDDAAIFTIHGFCQRALLENAFESGSLFNTEMITDQSALVSEVCQDFWRSQIMNEPQEFLEQLLAAGYTPDKLAKPFKGHYQDSGLTIIPPVGDPDMGLLVARRNALFPRLQPLWHDHRDALIELLTSSNLSQTSYKPAQIQTAITVLDAWFDRGDNRKPCPGLRLFSSEALLKGQKKGSTLPGHPFFDTCQELIDIYFQLEQAFTEKLIHRQTALHSWMKTELTNRKRSRNLRCFDDLLLDLHRALASDSGGDLAQSLRTRYRAALIDEFQDTDPLQWQIFSRLAGLITNSISGVGQGDEEEATQAYMALRQGASDEVNAEILPKAASYPLYLIGDPKQAIYSFRGADIFAYIAAARAVDEARQSTLDTNRRSVAPLVAAVNALFGAASDPFLCRDISFKSVNSGRDPGHGLLRNGQPLEQPLQFWVYPREDQTMLVNKGEACRTIVRTVAAEIARLLDGSVEIINKHGRRSLAAGDIAVLVKAHYQADLLQESLRNLGIPAVQHGSSTIFESNEALDLLRILRAANEPARERLVREALLTGTLGLSANQLAAYLAETDDDSAWEEWLLRFRGLQEAARTGGVISLAEQLLGECGVRRQALGQVGGERLLTNLMHCVELLHQAEQEQVLGLEGLITWLECRIAGKEENETTLLRLETDANAVQLSTIHASKGLEYPVVLLPFAWDAPSGKNEQVLFHDRHSGLTLDLGSEQYEVNKARAAEERAAEASRLLYVAITRAEFLCYVAWGCINKAQSSPLFPLLHGRTVSDPKAFKKHPDQAILADIRGLAQSSHGLAAAFMPVDAFAPPYQPPQDSLKPFTCRSLLQAISSDWRVSSFSGLTAGVERSQQPRDYDALSLFAVEYSSHDQTPRQAGYSIYDFPRGAAAGTCLHEILQRLDFAAVSDAHIEQISRASLRGAGYEDHWLAAVSRMTGAVTSIPLLTETPLFNLSQLEKGAWQTELEFFLPVAQLSPERLRQVFDGLLTPAQHGNFSELLASLQFQQSRGMLHGFMDLVFQHRDRYYLIDWKSNHLGFNGSDYAHVGMTSSMADHSYILQYHLYTLALDRHLRLHLPGYSYEAHFGGAIYVYLRGIEEENPQQGIYRDKPSTKFIERANRLLLG